MKWCNGPCGRLLPFDCYYNNGNGTLGWDCKACHRIRVRDRRRQLYRSYASWRAKEKKRMRDRYANDPQYRARKIAAGAAAKRRWRERQKLDKAKKRMSVLRFGLPAKQIVPRPLGVVLSCSRDERTG